MPYLNSVSGILFLFDEPSVRLQCLGFDRLLTNNLVDAHWFEVADRIAQIEEFYESDKFPERKKAALLASKVHFHLGSYEDALKYALGAEDLFDVFAASEYTNKIISEAIEQYSRLRAHNDEITDQTKKEKIDYRLESLVDRMFDRCFQHKQFKQALGIAMESHRLDQFELAIRKSGDERALLGYSVDTVLSLVQNRKYRSKLLRCLLKLYSELSEPDFLNMCQCLIFLDDPHGASDLLKELVTEESVGGVSNKRLMAFQLAFDLYESASQQYVTSVKQALSRISTDAGLPLTNDDKPEGVKNVNNDVEMKDALEDPTPSKDQNGESKDEEDADIKSAREELSSADEIPPEVEGLVRILGGHESRAHHMQFLIKNNKTDMLILKNIKDTIRNSICHTATVIANGMMHCGTTCDDFLRQNLEWVSKATNWSKFTAVASLGAIHNRHESEAMRLLESYLPKDSASPTSGYMEGGSLYALGLIHANHGSNEVIEYLRRQLEGAPQQEQIRHGACLGLGLAAMGTQRADVYDVLKQALFNDDAITGEAAGIAMGLVMLSSKSANAVDDMLSYAKETQHEKIVRGLAIGMSLLMLGRLEEADVLVQTLMSDKDPSIRRAGVYTVAMAYCGTGNNKAIKNMLHTSVSDVNDDVRRAAVTSLGFLLFRQPEQCPTMVSLLSESYNPHVRYGAALALGIACASSGNREAIALLEPMLQDSTNYVRQGCLIAMAMIMIQHNENTCAKVKDFRATLTKLITDKHEDIMTKFGAIMSQGILDAGGRNVSLSMMSRHGHTDVQAVVGMLIFLQHWFWFPLAHCLTLSFTPSCLIALNKDLKMPKMQFISAAKPSQFAYPPMLEDKKASDKAGDKQEAAVLSVTAKAKMKKKVQHQDSGMEVDDDDKMKKDNSVVDDAKNDSNATAMDIVPETSSSNAQSTADIIDNEKSKKSEDCEKEKKPEETADKEKKSEEIGLPKKKQETEPTFQILNNPARVLKQQLKLMKISSDSRYVPLKNVHLGGILMVRDQKAEEPLELVELEKAGGMRHEEETEPEPPEPFEYFDD